MIEIELHLEVFVFCVLLLIATAVFYTLMSLNNQPRVASIAFDAHENRKELLKQIEELENSLPVIRKETDFWDEFNARFPYITTDTQLHKDRLNEKRPIVVVGETSSGKSSFLNLMLNVPLLPVDHQHATAGIIKVQKSDKLAVIPKGKLAITTNDTNIYNNEEQAAKFVRETLKRVATSSQNGSNENEKTKATEVDVHWPFENLLLQEDITIVDTPGYGETEHMKELLMGYLHKAVGFLYIVNAGNAGGIQSDRLKRIIKDQHDYSAKHTIELIDPKRTLFFFNKWDQIQSRDEYEYFNRKKKTKSSSDVYLQQKVWNTNIDKLEQTWTKFTPDQAMKFSVSKAMNMITNQCPGIDEDQEIIARTKILSVIEDSLKNGLEPTKRWLTSVNNFITGTIFKHLCTAHATQSERKELMERYNSKKGEVNKETDNMRKQIPQEIVRKSKTLAANINHHLKSSSIKAEMQKWSYSDFPCSLVIRSTDTIKKEVVRVVLDKLSSTMERDMKYATTKISEDLKEYLNIETENIEKSLNELDSIISSVSMEYKTAITDKATAHGSFVNYDFAFDWFAFNYMDADLNRGLFDSEIFFKLIIVTLPFLFLDTLRTGRSPHEKILQETSIKIIQRVDINLLEKAISEKLTLLTKIVNKFFDEISRKISSQRKQFDHICNSTENPDHIIARYTRLRETLAPYLQKCEKVL